MVMAKYLLSKSTYHTYTTGPAMQVEVISDYSAFLGLKQEWNELADNFQSPLLRHEWADACLRTLYPKHTRPHIVVVRLGGQLRALAPLISLYQSGLRQLVMPGGNILHEPSGFLYDSEAALAELVHRLLKSRTSLMLPRFKVGSPEAWGVQQWPTVGRRFNKSGGSSLRVPLMQTWEEFEATMSPGRRSDLRCYRRRAEKLGKVEFGVVQPEVGTLTPHLQELFRVEASGWKGRAGSAILYQPSILRFYTEYAQSAAETGSLRLFFLRVGGKTVAARMGVEHSNRLWDLRLGYDEAFSRCAPGVLLTHETLRYAVERGLEAHEFLGQAEAWERHWPCEEDEYVSMRVYPFSLTGQLSLAQDVYQLALREGGKVVQGHLNRVRENALSGISALSSVLPGARSGTGGHNPSS
jgi:CelD/BcsL family acetyltransferase involved in cellulose biosynthesis